MNCSTCKPADIDAINEVLATAKQDAERKSEELASNVV